RLRRLRVGEIDAADIERAGHGTAGRRGEVDPCDLVAARGERLGDGLPQNPESAGYDDRTRHMPNLLRTRPYRGLARLKTTRGRRSPGRADPPASGPAAPLSRRATA